MCCCRIGLMHFYYNFSIPLYTYLKGPITGSPIVAKMLITWEFRSFSQPQIRGKPCLLPPHTWNVHLSYSFTITRRLVFAETRSCNRFFSLPQFQQPFATSIDSSDLASGILKQVVGCFWFVAVIFWFCRGILWSACPQQPPDSHLVCWKFAVECDKGGDGGTLRTVRRSEGC